MNPVQTIIDDTSVRPLQAIVFVLCFLLNVIDGMDVLIISFTAPVIATEWNVDAATLGVVFSAGLFGMMFGALLLAPFADTIGRRNLIMVSVVIIAISTWWTAYSASLTQLITLRVISGLGIGALLASAATMTAEYAPDRRRNVIVSICLAGYRDRRSDYRRDSCPNHSRIRLAHDVYICRRRDHIDAAARVFRSARIIKLPARKAAASGAGQT